VQHHHDRARQSPLMIKLDEVPETVLVPAARLSGGTIGAKIVYGRDVSIIIATRHPGYHSKPHLHDAEQLNYVLVGELYVFIDDTGFLVKEGDLFRVPRNAIHWSWVQGTMPCVLLEVHTPPLIGDPGITDTAVALMSDDEKRAGIVSIGSEWPRHVDQAKVERRVMTNPAVVF
jgi:mannose-6-phosphate isomerase-like protein (cupin superfamily)